MSTFLLLTVFAIFLCILYVVASPRFGEPFYRKDLFEPFKYPKGDYDKNVLEGIAAQDIFFPSISGDKLHAWHFLLPQAERTVIVYHGNTGNIADLQVLAGLLLRTGCSVFLFDYRGYGRSEGSPTVRGVCDDAGAAYDYLVNHLNVSPEKLVIYGESLGAGIAVQVIRTRSCAGLILQSGFASLRQAAREAMAALAIYPTWLFPLPFLDTSAILKSHNHPPLLILHGKNDPNLAFIHAETIFANASEPKTLVRLPHTLHDDIAEEDAETFVTAIKDFLDSRD